MEYRYVIVIAAVAAASVTLAKPHHATPRTVDLAEAINKTVCPIEVVVDEDEDRVPRRIKMMKCAREPNRYCIEQRIPQHECCQHSHNNHVMECVEMRDTVLVYYRTEAATRTFEVSVGCTCMIEQSTRAPALPAGPT